MTEILTLYPIEEILIILIVGVAALYALYKAYVYCKKQLTEYVIEKSEEMTIPTRIEALEESDQKQNSLLLLLMESDKVQIRIKLWENCQKFKKQGSIDERSWRSLSDMYHIYKEEGGNSWAEDVWEEIDSIPKDWLQ